ncbi:MAG: IclR family transcriptional regulator [Vicinamibacteraceae bacterium]
MRSAERTTHRVSERNPYITLVGKVLRIVEALRDAPEGLPLQALARRTGYVKSSIHRILLSLRQHGYVQQDEPGGPYRLGLKFVAIGRAVNGNVSLVQVVRPHLRELVAAFDESAYLAVLRGERGIFVDVQETSRDLRLVGPLGAEVHFHATAAGKAIAAFFPTERRAALLARLPLTHLTPRTITSRPGVERHWGRVRRLGIAVNHEETIVGAVFLAAPVFDAEPHVCGAISVGIPKARFSATLGRAMAAALKDTCTRLSETLAAAGYTHRMGTEPKLAGVGDTSQSTLAG